MGEVTYFPLRKCMGKEEILRSDVTNINISVIVPMYNEEAVVEEFYDRLKKVLENIAQTYEIVFIEDGSKDSTLIKLKEIQKKDDTVKLIRLRGNFGQTPALAAGFSYARGEIVIAMDGDLQHYPEDIPRFLEKIEEGYDIVSGWRADRKDPLLSRRFPSKIANWLMAKMSGIHLHDFGTTFKAYRREILQEIHLYGQFHRFIPVLANNLKASIVEIPIENVRQKHRKSHYNISRTFTVFFDLIRLNFFNKYLSRPLHVFGTFGLLLALSGFFINTYLIVMKYAYGLGLMTYRAPLFILGVLFIIIGVLFISLGLLGEMLFKLFHDMYPKRVYSIKEIYSNRE
ncbi:MAG: glycosyltransferase family 2 protein [Nitrospirota bacterium]